MTALQVDVLEGEERVAVAVAGELDIATCGQLEAALRPHHDTAVLLDISGCTFVDSSGVQELLSATRNNPRLRIREDFQPAVRQVLELVGLLRVLPLGDAERPDSPEPGRDPQSS